MADNPAIHLTCRPQLIFALLLSGMFATAMFMPMPSPMFTPEKDPFLAPAPVLPQYIPDFGAIADVDEKKQEFFNFLQPFVDLQNGRIQQQRERLLSLVNKLDQGQELGRSERDFLRNLSVEYEMEGTNYQDPDFLGRLLRRVDILPPSLVLAQAANESAWGTSRFALEGNNFFGQWCYTQGCGIVPSRRRANANHEVKAFESVEEAVQAYFMNLNTFPSYLDLRLIRESLREQAQPIDGISLSLGLESYSERGEEYISELQDMIRFNDLLALDLQLTPPQSPSQLD